MLGSRLSDSATNQGPKAPDLAITLKQSKLCIAKALEHYHPPCRTALGTWGQFQEKFHFIPNIRMEEIFRNH